MTDTETPRTLRADAAQNREKLLEAAASLFAARGAEIPLESVAKEAGLGVGTLYRHFPNRDALIEAVYRNEVDHLFEGVDELLDGAPADEAFAAWLEQFIAYGATKRGMSSALKAAVGADSELFASTRARMLATIGRFLEAGKQERTLRTDVDEEDVLLSVNGIWSIPEGPAWVDQARRVLRLVVDALRYRQS